MKPPTPCLLIDCVLDSLAAGQCVSAKGLARQWGADRVRVLAHLEAFRAAGLCHGRTINPRRKGHAPFTVFSPNPASILRHLSERHQTA